MFVNVRFPPDGSPLRYRIKGRETPLEEIRFEHDLVLVRADERVPWSFVAPLVHAARAAGADVEFAFEKEDPGFRYERVLAVPAPLPGEPLEIGDDATTGDVLRATLHLLHLRASGR